MKFLISGKIRRKLADKTPPVTEEDIVQCFSNRDGNFLEDTRENHKSDPPTQWFISETDYGVKLKVVFVYYPDRGVAIRTAYAPNDTEVSIYKTYGYK
ncbi:hypothetical protein LB105_003636 [Salmonella enterica]|uniref:ADP-ribosyl-(Dinitrogen reductase) hydrolase n=5 Tax=Salmonella enterica TaxID=28901 RepID=A0A5X8XSW3_SALNE|nr:hypothetical protein [Salmonella enterica subsp. enterica serovar Rubislaw]EAB1499803.1 hypothetical protein [Salmonella enterica]EAB6208819.1 hypothetical protein [Salmonella enterica subsp. enterica serovar Agbeni]EBF6639544.1 hypothetical protein [Salmonella enterica subsp. enterica serovar Reading]EBG0211776.1 hypothetical protein [Salmonella enterica subsp. enterica serovar Louisiana]EBQ4756783.1 hypothetical protein [Salmonella enterica subsp. diarizonae]EBR9314841.1 hypothetical pro